MPTIKQKKAFDKIVENHGNISKSMREVGYSEATAKNPKNLTKSKGWQEFLDKRIKDEKLVDVLDEGLKATRETLPDYAVRHRYLETGLKLKSKFPSEKIDLGAGEGLGEILIRLNKIIDE